MCIRVCVLTLHTHVHFSKGNEEKVYEWEEQFILNIIGKSYKMRAPNLNDKYKEPHNLI